MNLKRVYNCANKCYLCHISRVEKIFYRQVFFFVDFEDFEIFKIITLQDCTTIRREIFSKVIRESMECKISKF